MLPLCATIDEQIFCAHGGIPMSTTKLSHVAAAIPCPMQEPEGVSQTAWEVLWNDPVSSKEFDQHVALLKAQNNLLRLPAGYIPNSKRGTAYFFSDDAVHAFLATNGLSHVIRAHEVTPDGYYLHCNGKVITIFSSSRYCGMLNEAAVALVDCNKIRIMKVETRGH